MARTERGPAPAMPRLRLALILLIALVQGVLFALVVPPWQHYDEPTHFEYVRRYAELGYRPTEFDRDVTLRREIAASMAAHGLFAQIRSAPDLVTDSPNLWIGIPEFYHPPLYYFSAAQPLRLLLWLPLEAQLYALRLFSVALLVSAVAVAAALAAELVSAAHPLRWLLPLSLALLPTFADTMTAVNNDGASILLVSVLLWACVRMIVRGVTWLRLLGALLALGLGIVTKTTAAIGLVLLPIALVIALWAWRGWRWRWLALGVSAPPLLLLLSTLSWGDAAYWYRDGTLPTQQATTLLQLPDGQRALLITVAPGGKPRALLNPLTPEHVRSLAGALVTVGGWAWADAAGSQAELAFRSIGENRDLRSTRAVTLTTTPTFVAFETRVPTDTQNLLLEFRALPGSDVVRSVYLRDALVVAGPLRSGAPRVAADGSGGTWDGAPFSNVLRGSAADQMWPRVRPWFDDLGSGYLRRSVSQVIAALADVNRVGVFVLLFTAQITFPGLVRTFGWGQIELDLGAAGAVLAALALSGVAGAVWWLFRTDARRAVRLAAVFLGLAFASVLFGVVSRPLPALDTVTVPTARYLLPAALPLLVLISGGFLILWPPRTRTIGALLFAVALLALDIAALRLLAGPLMLT